MTPSKIKDVRGEIEALRLALLSPMPEEMDKVLPGLQEAARHLAAIEQLAALEQGVGQAVASYEVHRELQLLKNDLRIVTRLIEHGVAFCRGWARMIGVSPAYTQAGEPLPFAGSGATLSLRG